MAAYHFTGGVEHVDRAVAKHDPGRHVNRGEVRGSAPFRRLTSLIAQASTNPRNAAAILAEAEKSARAVRVAAAAGDAMLREAAAGAPAGEGKGGLTCRLPTATPPTSSPPARRA